MPVTADDWPWEPRFRDVGEGRMHYVDVGTGPTVVLVHGTPTSSYEWRHVIRALAGTHRVIAPDHLGFGRSDRPDVGYRPEDHAERFRRFVTDLDRFTLVVHDYGGPIALPVALDQPERIERLVIVNTWMWSLADDPKFRMPGWLAGTRLFRWLYGYANLSLRVIAPSAWGDRSKLTPDIQEHYLAAFPDPKSRMQVLWPLARALLGSTAFYDTLWAKRSALASVPALVVWGLKDSAFQPYLLGRWREALPHAEVVEIAGAGHWPHEEEPELVVAALQRFLSR
jgi:haloalkane dehalogenase